MTKVLIVDDHASLRDSFRAAFESGGGFCVVGETPDAACAAAFCQQLSPDLVLMDVCTEGGSSGLEATQQLKQQFPGIRVIVMSGFDEISYAPRAREAGADAFVYKSKSMGFFLQVARGVMEGRSWFPEPKTIPLPTGEAPLTDREMEILRLICKYKSRKEIAEELFIQPDTVKYHISNMLGKTGCASAAELAIMMISNGWINPKY